jgi:hypothetical protein
MAVGALTKSCAKMLDCTKSTGDAFTLDALPGVTCWEGEHLPMAVLGAAGLFIYCVMVPLKLYCTLRRNAADGQWSNEELEAHAWLLLKVRSAMQLSN